jgi:putative nucleotidyltransferase with HDIG domain
MDRSPSRDDALAVVREFTTSDSLIKHMLGVEAAMRAYARHFGEDEQLWAIVGLLHDFDYEIHPSLENHPADGAPILRERGYPEEIIYAVLSHADHLALPRNGLLEKTLFAVDELVGLITATTYVRPSRSILDVDVAAVKKKMKDKAFARAVSREDIVHGAEDLGVSLDEHIGVVLLAMQDDADELGLRGANAGAR